MTNLSAWDSKKAVRDMLENRVQIMPVYVEKFARHRDEWKEVLDNAEPESEEYYKALHGFQAFSRDYETYKGALEEAQRDLDNLED
ncbi:hypothetical protein FACS1894103_5730 [Campylobacterota bacterium]|nr:hypothetical protein FACS1894103_5730 [Campylobacterota bacterium]